MREKKEHLSSLKEEYDFATAKVKEYPYHLPIYQYEKSVFTILGLLYESDKSSEELINAFRDTISTIRQEKNNDSKPNKIFKQPFFQDKTVFMKQSYSTTNSNRKEFYQYSEKQLPRLHLIDILFNHAHIFNCWTITLGYIIFVKNLLKIDLNDNGIPVQIRNILSKMQDFFRLEMICNEEFNPEKNNATASSLMTEIRSYINKLSFSCPLWNNANLPVIAIPQKMIRPKTGYFSQTFDIYLYYTILWEYVFLTNNKLVYESKHHDWLIYQSNIQKCFALYLLENIPEHKALRESVRTMRYFFANKVFQSAITLIKFNQISSKDAVLISPYLNSFLKTNFARPEDNAIRKKNSQHSPTSDYFDGNALRKKLEGLTNGIISTSKLKYVALPLRKNKPFIGVQNLAYVLGIPESHDFINQILKKTNLRPTMKIPTKISECWPKSVNILSHTFDENDPINWNFYSGRNLGFLLFPQELQNFSRQFNLFKQKEGGIKNLCNKIKTIAKKDGDCITTFDISYIKLFDKKFYGDYYYNYFWFTLPFLHITKVLSKIQESYPNYGELTKRHTYKELSAPQKDDISLLKSEDNIFDPQNNEKKLPTCLISDIYFQFANKLK